MKLFRALVGCHTINDSMFYIIWPLTTVLRLVSTFYVEFTPTEPFYKLNFFHYRNLSGWSLLGFCLIHLIIQCTTNYVTCSVQVFLNLSFIPLCLLTEGNMRDIFNTIASIDSRLKELGHPGIINHASRTVKLLGYMMLHMICIAVLMYFGKSYSTPSKGILFSFFYMAVQRRFTFVSVKFFCDEVSLRFRHVEGCWVRAYLIKDVEKMEEVRLLYHKVHSAVDHLSKTFGLRLLHLIVDISLQCTRFFIFTFMTDEDKNYLFFISFIMYQYYCLHSTVTASENLTIQSRSLLKHLIGPPWYKMAENVRIQVELMWTQIEDCCVEISVCGFIAYNRSLILTWGSGMVTLWVLLIQTYTVISQVFLYFDLISHPQ